MSQNTTPAFYPDDIALSEIYNVGFEKIIKYYNPAKGDWVTRKVMDDFPLDQRTVDKCLIGHMVNTYTGKLKQLLVNPTKEIMRAESQIIRIKDNLEEVWHVLIRGKKTEYECQDEDYIMGKMAEAICTNLLIAHESSYISKVSDFKRLYDQLYNISHQAIDRYFDLPF